MRRAAFIALVLGACGGGDVASDLGVDALPPSSASFAETSRFDIVVARGKHLAFPDLTRLSDGRILLVYREGASHVDASGRLMKAFGSADGATWSTPEVLYDAPGIDDRDPSVTTLAGGDVLVNYFQYTTQAIGGTTLATHHVFVGRSRDGGASFGAFAQADDGSMTPAGPMLDGAGQWVDSGGAPLVVRASSSAVVELDGELVLPVYGGHPLNLTNLAATPRSRISLLRSSDGAAWTEQPVLTGDATDTWLQEPALLQLASGKRLLQLRTAKGSSPSNAGDLMQSSAGAAADWSAPAPLGFVGHAPELAQLSSGLVLSGYRQLDDALTQEWTSFSWSLDDGATWSAPIQVEDCGAIECGYPAILELDAAHFLYAYYAPGGTAITAVIYQVTLQ